jgi:hypothetical protein
MVAPYKLFVKILTQLWILTFVAVSLNIVNFPFFMVLTSCYKYFAFWQWRGHCQISSFNDVNIILRILFALWHLWQWRMDIVKFPFSKSTLCNVFLAAKPLHGVTMLRKKSCNNLKLFRLIFPSFFSAQERRVPSQVGRDQSRGDRRFPEVLWIAHWRILEPRKTQNNSGQTC